MTANRRLTEADLVEARWFYENAAVSSRQLAASFGIARSTLEYWIKAYAWKKYTVPDDPELRDRNAQAARARQVERDARYAHDAEVARGMQAQLDQLAADSATQPPPADQGIPPTPSVALAPLAEFSARAAKSASELAAVIIPFPGAHHGQENSPRNPAGGQPGEASGATSREDREELKIRLAALRGKQAVRLIDLVDQQHQLLSDYTHLVRVHMAPQRYIDVGGLEPEAAEEKVGKVQRAVRNIILPSDRDTLSGTVKTLNACLSDLIEMNARIAGTSMKNKPGNFVLPGSEEPAAATAPAFASLDVNKMREMRAMMDLLNGDVVRASEPPKPPPPESLDDLVSTPDPPPEPR